MSEQKSIADFETIYYPDGTCTHWWCSAQGVVLAYDSFSPECAHWFCAGCWYDEELQEVQTFDIVKDNRVIPTGEVSA